MSYKYILERYAGRSSRYTCPGCNAKNEFTRYKSIETNQYLSETVGKCNRTDKCGYHYAPQQFLKDNSMSAPNKVLRHIDKIELRPISYIDPVIVSKSMQDYDRNYFIKYLVKKFGTEKTNEQISRYRIGTSKHWHGSTVFWQQDVEGKIRTGKIMLYSPDTGKRIKEPYNCISWAHKALELAKFNLKQCFFGEHLLAGNKKPIALVESEKTAIIASIFMPDYIWIAAGNKEGLISERCKVLEGRKVILYPDLLAFDYWYTKAMRIPYLNGFSISDLLEKRASPEDRAAGLDLADYLVRYEYPLK